MGTMMSVSYTHLDVYKRQPAPYLQYLGRYDETGLSGDLTQAKDMGAYYAVPGEISVPASITREQLQTCLLYTSRCV